MAVKLTDNQKAAIYLVAKALRSRDFAAFMNVSAPRASNLTNPENIESCCNWSEKTKKRAFEATNGGLDIDAEYWKEIEKILTKLAKPDVTYKSMEAAKKILGVKG